MPETLRSTLLAKIQVVFPSIIQDVNTFTESHQYSYKAIHFSIYNRFATKVCAKMYLLLLQLKSIIYVQGDHAPTAAHPSTLQRDGRKPIHSAFNVPRWSEEAKDSMDKFCLLEDAFESVFLWISEQVCHLDTFNLLNLIFVSFLD